MPESVEAMSPPRDPEAEPAGLSVADQALELIKLFGPDTAASTLRIEPRAEVHTVASGDRDPDPELTERIAGAFGVFADSVRRIRAAEADGQKKFPKRHRDLVMKAGVYAGNGRTTALMEIHAGNYGRARELVDEFMTVYADRL